ncbi:MAG: hypothetical protein DDT33_01436 [Firmicutes bacterium]|nr:hypothetical protein [Bacillota bacterium]
MIYIQRLKSLRGAARKLQEILYNSLATFGFLLDVTEGLFTSFKVFGIKIGPSYFFQKILGVTKNTSYGVIEFMGYPCS